MKGEVMSAEAIHTNLLSKGDENPLFVKGGKVGS
jgi:hypothetical protein